MPACSLGLPFCGCPLPACSLGLPFCGCPLPACSLGLPFCGCPLPACSLGLPFCGCPLPACSLGLPFSEGLSAGWFISFLIALARSSSVRSASFNASVSLPSTVWAAFSTPFFNSLMSRCAFFSSSPASGENPRFSNSAVVSSARSVCFCLASRKVSYSLRDRVGSVSSDCSTVLRTSSSRVSSFSPCALAVSASFSRSGESVRLRRGRSLRSLMFSPSFFSSFASSRASLRICFICSEN